MDREIKFRGLSLENQWVYGSFSNQRLNGSWIEHKSEGKHHLTHVNDETVGQYTELKDKNGKEIYGGDIVTDGVLNYVVTFYAGAWCLKLGIENSSWHSLYPVAHQRKVIGNIYENKDLLK